MFGFGRFGREGFGPPLGPKEGPGADAMETVAESEDKDLAEEIVRFFVDNGQPECFAPRARRGGGGQKVGGRHRPSPGPLFPLFKASVARAILSLGNAAPLDLFSLGQYGSQLGFEFSLCSVVCFNPSKDWRNAGSRGDLTHDFVTKTHTCCRFGQERRSPEALLAACLYTCYDLVRADVALELAWRHKIFNRTPPAGGAPPPPSGGGERIDCTPPEVLVSFGHDVLL